MLEKGFTAGEAEARLYEGWERAGAFAADPKSSAAPFTIMIPPPNVTGTLHVGHALTFTIQDALVRYRRMQGRDVLWQPGTDHAGIATQMVVERELAAEPTGGQTSRQALGRAAFLERVWQWKAQSGGTITTQLRRLGCSLDWARERFTMDEGMSAAVREVFVRLHGEELIYRDQRLVNWDPQFQTAISDLEVESRETSGSMWHFRYPIDGSPGEFITVATTRPETMLGDTGIVVHPEDERWAGFVGREAVLPLTGRRIPIRADAYADPAKGTGAVKITPAHDFNDFEVGLRQGMPAVTVLDRQGRVTLAEIAWGEDADQGFARSLEGVTREAARRQVVEEMDRLGLLAAVQPAVIQVPHGDRSGVVIEPRLTVQWYCRAKALAPAAVAAVETGDVQFVPRQWENTFFAWMRDIQPWCISRQLWWGHRIPAWYGPDEAVFVAHDAAAAAAQAEAHYGRAVALRQDEDVLDTWFSSALWPFSTLGWPEETAELARYYPGDVLVTGFDIIFFWVARMLMMGLHLRGDVPFRKIIIHGLVRDERGQKMSKSRGNVIDPLALIDSFGADALRFTVCALTGPGRDVKLGSARVEGYRGFVTKLWNAARLLEMNGAVPGQVGAVFEPYAVASPLCRWLLDGLNTAVAEASAALEAFRFDEYAAACYRFTWGTLCDWFLEFAKPVFAAGGPAAEEARATGSFVLGAILRLLHPAMPFVTEELWDSLGYGAPCSLIRAYWPEPVEVEGAAAAAAELDWVVRFVSAVRAVRAEMNVPPSVLAPVLLRDAAPATLARGERWIEPIRRMARVSALSALTGAMPGGAVQAVVDEATLVLPLEGIVDLAAERARLVRERERAASEAAKVERKLGNAEFVAKAKPEVVAENRERLAAFLAEARHLEAAIQALLF